MRLLYANYLTLKRILRLRQYIDDMGLGKTMQVLTYLGSLMRAETISNAIIICPKSVVQSWEREANLNLKNICVPKATITAVTSDMGKEKRKRVFEDAFVLRRNDHSWSLQHMD